MSIREDNSFRITPYHRNIARSILKTPKFYFYDTGQVIGDSEIRLENLTACALLKEIHFLEDCFGEERNLHYLQTKDGKEIDFFITWEDRPQLMLEVKWADTSFNRNFALFDNFLQGSKKIQIAAEMEREKTLPGEIEIRQARTWLANIQLSPSTK